MLIGTSWAQGGHATFENRRETDQLGDEYKHPCFFASFLDCEGVDPDTFELPACNREVNQTKIIKFQSREIELNA